MLNAAILWIMNGGIKLGAVVLCIMCFRVILQRKHIPRIFSYAFWGVLPLMVSYSLAVQIWPGLAVQRPVRMEFVTPLELEGDGFLLFKTIWIIGAIIVAAGICLVYFLFRRYLIGSIRLKGNIYLASRIKTPFTMGLFNPIIYIPTSLEEKYHEAVILHEQVHIRRKDIWIKCFSFLFLVLFWFQPLIWIAYRLFINDMEQSCDEAVLKEKEEKYPCEYARTVVEVSYHTDKTQGTTVGYGSGDIKKRVNNILRFKRAGFFVLTVAFFFVTMFTILTISLFWNVPQMVRREFSSEKKTIVAVEESVTEINIGIEVDE